MTTLLPITNYLNKINGVAAFCNEICLRIQRCLERENPSLHESMKRNYEYDFLLMSQYVRLGTIMESIFKDFYMHKKNMKNLSDLKNDPEYKKDKGVFQKTNPTKPNDSCLQKIYLTIGINLEELEKFLEFKIFMLSRHIYAHSSGVLDEKYISDYKELTGINLKNDEYIKSAGYPEQDVYWFKPLRTIGQDIENAKKLVSHLQQYV